MDKERERTKRTSEQDEKKEWDPPAIADFDITTETGSTSSGSGMDVNFYS